MYSSCISTYSLVAGPDSFTKGYNFSANTGMYSSCSLVRNLFNNATESLSLLTLLLLSLSSFNSPASICLISAPGSSSKKVKLFNKILYLLNPSIRSFNSRLSFAKNKSSRSLASFTSS